MGRWKRWIIYVRDWIWHEVHGWGKIEGVVVGVLCSEGGAEAGAAGSSLNKLALRVCSVIIGALLWDVEDSSSWLFGTG